MVARLLIVLTLAVAPQVAAPPAQMPEAISLFGKPLVVVPPTGDERVRLDANLARAQAVYDRDLASADAAIWLGRRLAYLGRYRDAIDVYTRGSQRHPNEPRLCHRRGLANDFEQALAAYREGMKVSRVNDDMLVATSDWLYMTLRRLKCDGDARQVPDPIREQMDVLENDAYLARLLMYKGLRSPDSVLNLNTADDVQIATQGYCVGNWHLVNGDANKAREVFERVLSGKAWTAFGFIAAEADFKRGL